MRSLIRQLLAEEFKTFSGSRKRLRSCSTSVERVPVGSHTAPDPDPMDEHNTACFQGSMGNSSGKVIPSEKTIPNNLNQASSNYEEPEIQITPLPGEFVCLFVFVALRPMSTAMVIAGRSVHLTTLFPGQA